MNRAAWDFLISAAGRDLLAELAAADLSEAHLLPLLSRLRRDWPAEIAGAAVTLARLRVRAADKFSRAGMMFFTPDALEQASGETISAWSARRFAGWDQIADLGCGIGGDSLALAATGAAVIGLDRDALRLDMARANLAAYDRTAAWLQADLTDPLPLALRGVRAAFFDPARRDAGQRVYSVQRYLPPLSVIDGWSFEALAVKLSPGVDLDELRPYIAQGAGVEFVSRAGELKEAILWRGAFGFGGRWASRLEADGSADTLTPLDLDPPPLSLPRAYLIEPDPAVIRAGLFGELAARLNLPLFRLDEQIAYLTADTRVESSWARCWPVWDWLPFNLKRLRALLTSLNAGDLTVKKRGSPILPDDLLRQLKWRGSGRPAVIVLTQIAGQHSAVVCGAS